MKKLLIIATVAATSLMQTGCSDDFLVRYPESEYTGESYYSSDEAVMKACEPLYNRAWFNFNRRAILGIGSSRANDAWNPYVIPEFTRFQTTSLTLEVAQAWSSLYTVVTMSNAIIRDVTKNCSDAVSEEVKSRALGEAYLMRGSAYFYMVRTWGPVILFEDNDHLVNNPLQPLNPEEDVFKFLLRDLRKAAELLPEEGANGRASKYAAKAMLAKALLAHSGWNKGGTRDADELAECVELCEEVIDKSGARLMEDYGNLFRYQYNNNEESLFAMQWADPLVGGWGECNPLGSDLSWGEVTDVSSWGNNNHASIDMIDLYNEDPKDQERLHATFFIPNSYHPTIKAAEGGYTYKHNWMQVKKGVPGTKADNDGHLVVQRSPLNTYIIRLADVYLTHAEASLGNSASLNSGRGLESFNAVRRRAGVDEYSEITFEDIIRERRIEFCMEYCNWFDMVSWYRWKPDYMLDYFNRKQHRGYELQDGGVELREDGFLRYNILNYVDENDEKIWNDSEGFDPFEAREAADRITVTDENVFMPYPEADMLQNPNLAKEPQPYDFGEN